MIDLASSYTLLYHSVIRDIPPHLTNNLAYYTSFFFLWWLFFDMMTRMKWYLIHFICQLTLKTAPGYPIESLWLKEFRYRLTSLNLSHQAYSPLLSRLENINNNGISKIETIIAADCVVLFQHVRNSINYKLVVSIKLWK